MSKLKKILVTSLMVLVSCFTFMGTAISNVARTIFSFGNANASSSPARGNSNNTPNEVSKGSILSVPFNKEASFKKGGPAITLPYVNEVKVTDPTNASLGDETPGSSALGASVANYNLFVKITNPFGREITKENKDANSGNNANRTEIVDAVETSDVKIEGTTLTLKPSIIGEYNVQYFALDAETGVWTSSIEYSVAVTSELYDMQLIENDSVIMPKTVSTKDENPTVQIALPVVYDENNKIITTPIVLGSQFVENETTYHYEATYTTLSNVTGLDSVSDITLGAEDKNTYEEYKTYTVKKVEGAVDVSSSLVMYIDINSSNGYTNNASSSIENKLTLAKENIVGENTAYQKAAYSFQVSSGKNVIKYTLEKDGVRSSFSYVINGSETLRKDKINLTASASSSVRPSMTSRGEKTYLPKVTATNKDNNQVVDAYYYYTVKVKGNDGYNIDKENVTMGRDEKGFYFIPKAAANTTYEIYFNVRDFYGNKAENDVNYDYRISVTDRKLDEYHYVGSYDPAAESIDITDVSYSVKNKVKIGGEIAIPAIYAKDKYGIDHMTRSISSDFFVSKSDPTKKVTGGSLTINDSNGAQSLSPSIYQGEDGADPILNTILTYKDVDLTHPGEGEGAEKTGFIVKDNKFYKPDGVTELTGREAMLAKASQTAYIKIDAKVFMPGTYKVNLNVGDKANNTNKDSTFIFTVVKAEDTITYTDPTVKFDSDLIVKIGNVKDGQEVSVPVPTVRDDIDDKLLVKYYVVAGPEAGLSYIPVKSEDGKTIKFNTNLDNGSGKTIYQLAVENGSKFEVRAYAYNDAVEEADLLAGPEDYTAGKNIGMGSQVITVNYSTDDKAPVITAIDDVPTTAPVQFKSYKVGGVTFLDNTDSASIQVSVVDSKGNPCSYSEVAPVAITKSGENWQYKFEGIEFVTENANADNYYTVTYSLVDSGNNTVAYSFVIAHAADREAPTISSPDGMKFELELGETLYLNQIEASDNLTNKEDIKLELDKCELNGRDFYRYYNSTRKEFTPLQAGTYTLSIIAYDNAPKLESDPDSFKGNASQAKEITVVVKDSKAPVIELQSTNNDANATIGGMVVSEEMITNNDNKIPTVHIPMMSSKDTPKDLEGNHNFKNVFGSTNTLTIKVPNKKYSSSDETEFVFNLDETLDEVLADTENKNKLGLKVDYASSSYNFTPKARGEYKVTYTSVDKAGNKSEETIIINIGDTEKPRITMTDVLKNKLAEGFVLGENATLTINNNARVYGEDDNYKSDDLYVIDNSGFETKENSETHIKYVPVKVEIKGPDGILKADNEDDTEKTALTYTFTKAGTYTILFKVSDINGNDSDFSPVTFTVKAKPSKSLDSSTILGTVLIVISIAVLVGVTIYFIKGTKTLPKKNKKVTKKDDKKENKEEKND